MKQTESQSVGLFASKVSVFFHQDGGNGLSLSLLTQTQTLFHSFCVDFFLTEREKIASLFKKDVSGGLDHSGFDTKLRYDGGPFFSRFENIKAL